MVERESYGEPDLKIAGFQLWIHGREFPNSGDYYDGNWLRVTAHCGAQGADVWTNGSLLMSTDIYGFGADCEKLLNHEGDNAVLNPIEPGLKVSLGRSDSLGHFLAVINITPDHMTQEHRFEFEIDQTFVSNLIGQCQRIVKTFPVRGAEQLLTKNKLP
jgi:hypothetical protein